MCSKHDDMSVFKIPVAFLSSSRMRGSILCSLYLWIPAYAGMTGESLRNPVPELVEGRHGPAFVILAYAGIHSLELVSMDSRIRGNDGREPP